MERPKLLFLAADFPMPVASGAQIRQMHLLRSLARRFDITLVARSMQDADHAYLPELEQIVQRVVAVRPDNRVSRRARLLHKLRYLWQRTTRGASNDHFYLSMPRMTRAIQDELQRQSFDVVFAMYWYWDAKVWETSAFKVIDTNDVHWHRTERLLQQTRNPWERLWSRFLIQRYREREAQALRSADLLVAITDKDEAELRTMTGNTVPLVTTPTGLDTDWFVPQGEPRSQQIAFFGAMRNPMNRDAVVHLVEDIWPRLRQARPELELHLIGAGAPPEVRRAATHHPGIHVSGYVEDIREPLRRSSIVVLPLRFGWGIRGRVYEIMSLGIPVVATPVAVEGMDLQDGEGIVLAETPEATVAAVLQLLDDDTERRRMAEAGRRVAVERASIAATYDLLTEHLTQQMAGNAPGPADDGGNGGMAAALTRRS